jgi:hypothetical protein
MRRKQNERRRKQKSSHFRFTTNGMNDSARWYERLSNSQPLDVNSLLRLLSLAKEHLANQPTLLDLPAPITICGDIHGQFSDLLTLMSLDIGQRILFLGDFVDRGPQSVETISFLLVRMVLYIFNRILMKDAIFILHFHSTMLVMMMMMNVIMTRIDDDV